MGLKMVDWAANTTLSLQGLELMQEPSNLLVVGSIPTEGAKPMNVVKTPI